MYFCGYNRFNHFFHIFLIYGVCHKASYVESLIVIVWIVEALLLLICSIYIPNLYRDYSFFKGWILGIATLLPAFTYILIAFIELYARFSGMKEEYKYFCFIAISILLFLYFIYCMRTINEQNKMLRT